MKKEDFLKAISNEDEAVVSKLFDKVSLAQKSGKTVYTKEFYTPGIWSRLTLLSSNLEVNVLCDGIFQEAERRLIAFYNKDEVYMPLSVICILNKSKFHKLQHKDYLGALMSLGIKREKVGDLIVDDSKCYCVVCDDIVTYLVNNLTYIAHCPCEVMEIMDFSSIPTYNFEAKVIVSTSMRADCIVSSISGQSRTKSVDMLKAGKVQINYNEVREKDFEVTVPSTLTIRGYGKFKVVGVIGNSSSGRLKIQLKKFV